MKIKDIAMYSLGTLLVLGFFGLLGLLIFRPIPTVNNEVLYLAIGALISGFTTVVNYFYGSSAGSAQKSDLISKKFNEVKNER